MNKVIRQEIENISKAEITEIIPTSGPVSNRQAYVDSMAQKILSGEMTVFDVGRELQLTENQIAYCQNFVVGDTMGNGTQSAILAYNFDPLDKMERQEAANLASRMNKPSHPCSTLIQILINGQGLNANNLDQNLLFICQQNYDLKAKTLAIREANTILGRNTKKQIEVTISHKLDFSALPKKDLQKLIEIARKCQVNDESD